MSDSTFDTTIADALLAVSSTASIRYRLTDHFIVDCAYQLASDEPSDIPNTDSVWISGRDVKTTAEEDQESLQALITLRWTAPLPGQHHEFKYAEVWARFASYFMLNERADALQPWEIDIYCRLQSAHYAWTEFRTVLRDSLGRMGLPPYALPSAPAYQMPIVAGLINQSGSSLMPAHEQLLDALGKAGYIQEKPD